MSIAADGCVIVTLAVVVQLFASVIVTVYVFALKPVAVLLFNPALWLHE